MKSIYHCHIKSSITLITLITLFTLFTLSSFGQAGYLSTLAGNGTPGLINSTFDNTRFNHPFGICVKPGSWPDQEIYVADADNHCIRLLTNDSSFTVAGTGVAGFLDGPALQAKFNSPSGICCDYQGNVYVSDFQNQRIRKISNGVVTTIAGTGLAGFQDGPGNTAKFNYPRGICIDDTGNLYVADSWNHRIRKITPDGMVSTYAGGGTSIGVGSAGGYIDAQDTAARFYTPSGITHDHWGNFFVADAFNHRIRSIYQGNVATYAGSGPTGPGNGGHQNGHADSARFNTPTDLVFGSGPYEYTLYISDTYNNKIRTSFYYGGITQVWDLAGSGQPGFNDGYGDTCSMNYPRGITGFFFPTEYYMFFCDYNNHAIRTMNAGWGAIHEEASRQPILKLYPNPVDNILNVEIINNQSFKNQLLVTDLLGRRVFEGKIEGYGTINTSDWISGVYLIWIGSDTCSRVIKKVIKL
ncbi:MAG: T9SS type A sorting domain-containing protein [Bacteroidetes bacterium]|nr:T9SS type A sorting domain-containing protein [Bacteroidota bacterium]